MIDRSLGFPVKVVLLRPTEKPLGFERSTDPQVQLRLVLVSELPRRTEAEAWGQWVSLHVTNEFVESFNTPARGAK